MRIMANPFHDLADLIKDFADKFEAVFKKDAPAAEAAVKTAGEAVVSDAEAAAAPLATEALHAAEAAAPAVESAVEQAVTDLHA
jgi:hypothetical protein